MIKEFVSPSHDVMFNSIMRQFGKVSCTMVPGHTMSSESILLKENIGSLSCVCVSLFDN